MKGNNIGDRDVADLIDAISHCKSLEYVCIDETGASFHTAEAIYRAISPSRLNKIGWIRAESCNFGTGACRVFCKALQTGPRSLVFGLRDSIASFDGLLALKPWLRPDTPICVEWEGDDTVHDLAGDLLPRPPSIDDCDVDSRKMGVLVWRRAHEARRNAGMVFQAASQGRPLELGKRLRLGRLAGGLDREGRVSCGRDRWVGGPAFGALGGGHGECLGQLLRESSSLGWLWPCGERVGAGEGDGGGMCWLEACVRLCVGGSGCREAIGEWARRAGDGLGKEVRACELACERVGHARQQAQHWRGQA